MTNTILLFVSMLFTLVFFILGMMLIANNKDNPTKIILGSFISFSCVLLFSYSATYLPFVFDGTPYTLPSMLLSIDILLILILMDFILSLFPLLSLNPDWSWRKTTLTIAAPSLFLALLYLLFSTGFITETPLYNRFSISGNFYEIKEHLGRFDVLLRVILMFSIPVIPVVVMAVGSLIHISHKNRKPTINFRIYYFALIVLSIIFFSYLIKLPYSIILFVIYMPAFSAVVAIGYYRDSSYLSTFAESPAKEKEPVVYANDISFSDIWGRFNSIMTSDHRFTDLSIHIQTIADEMKINKVILYDCLHLNGYNSFKEYLNILRINRFKMLAEDNPDREITDLYESAGFNSKTTFYRIFSTVEGMTPSEYMKKICKTRNL